MRRIYNDVVCILCGFCMCLSVFLFFFLRTGGISTEPPFKHYSTGGRLTVGRLAYLGYSMAFPGLLRPS